MTLKTRSILNTAVWVRDRETVARMISIVLVLCLAAGLRVWHVNQIGFNTDEAVYSGQAAAIAQVPGLKEIFPVFRAHPLLFQFVLALLFNFGVSDLMARLLAVAVGVATVYLVYRLGSLLYGDDAGIIAALILAVMPYHVVVSRQVLLDGPLVLFTTLTLYLLARFAFTENPVWMYLAGLSLGLTFLAKETGIILLGSVYMFFALASEIKIRFRDLVISFFLMALMILPFPVSLMLAGGSHVGQQYLIWQLFRRPNHTWDFYLQMVPVAIGFLVLGAAFVGLWLLRHERSWREKLLIVWILVPVIFFQIWPTKGFQYLLPIAPPFAVLAARTLIRWTRTRNVFRPGRYLGTTWIRAGVGVFMILNLFFSSSRMISPSTSGTFIAGTGGVPGGRETGEWINQNLPAQSTLLTIGPSMANILEFYGYRTAFGLSVSPNPLRRNPSYQPVLNPDLQIRNGDIHYIVWDSYSAERSKFFADAILRYANRYHGRVIHVESVNVLMPDGSVIAKPVIVIYEVTP